MATVPARAGDEPPAKDCDENETISITVEDEDVVVTSRCDGREKVVMVNLDAVEGMVSEVIGDVALALEDMQDMQLQIHLGQDNRLHFADDDTEWEVDLDQIARQVEAAFEAGFDEMESTAWTRRRVRDESDLRELRRELERLQREMKRLRTELESAAADR